jgi:hypothetical protein
MNLSIELARGSFGDPAVEKQQLQSDFAPSSNDPRNLLSLAAMEAMGVSFNCQLINEKQIVAPP